MASTKSVVGIGFFFISFFCFVSWKHSIIGVKDAFLLAGRVLLVIGLSTWMMSCLYSRWRAFFCSTTCVPSECWNPDPDNDQQKLQQRLARNEQQEKHSEMALSYQESVVRPRQESLLRKREERFYSMTGGSWKLTQGELLGEGELEECGQRTEEGVYDTPNQSARRRRKLPECPIPPAPQREPPEKKRVVVLPEEPADGDQGVVRVALRCPTGRTVHRKFLKSHCSLVLLDWLHKIGYHPTIFTIYSSYPRKPLMTGIDLSLEDAGIGKDTVLNVEEKDPTL